MINRKQLIEIKHLRTFYHVSKYKSFTMAAEALYMTQPAVSQHMKKIETQIGTSLFERSGGFELTKEGEILLKYAKQSFSVFDELFDELERSKNRDSYKIAISYSFCALLRENLFKELNKMSNLNFTVVHYHSTRELNCLDFDLIFGVDNIPEHLGHKVHIQSRNYKIVSKSKNLIYDDSIPKRIIYCSNLAHNNVIDIIKAHGGNTEKIKGWLSTSSTEVIKNELAKDDTIIISSKKLFEKSKYHIKTTDVNINMYAWCNNRSRVEVRKIGLFDIINKLIDYTNCVQAIKTPDIINNNLDKSTTLQLHANLEKIIFTTFDGYA